MARRHVGTFQLLSQIAQQWPPGSPHPVLDVQLIAVPERFGIADLIPAVFRSDLLTKE